MDIRNRRELKEFAGQRLTHSQKEKQVVLYYAALTLGVSALVTVINYALGLKLDTLTGLSSFRTKTTLSAIQSLLPMAASLFGLCLEVGYLAAMLRAARGQYTSPNTLRLGFDRFWVLLRVSIFQSFLYSAVLFLSIYAGIMIFMISPLSDTAVEILTPYLADMSILDSAIVLEDGVYAQFAASIWPAYLICGGLFLLAAVPIWYSYRMVNYVVIDKPGLGALAAMRMSKFMMRRNRVSLLKLDVSFWWYYLLLLLAQAVCYGDVLLPLLGISLPGNPDIWYFVFLAAYLGLLFGVYFFLRSKVEVSYALVYDSVKPEEPKNEGVVLGNIFQM